ADANLSGGPLHHGWALGRLQLDEQRSRFACHRRSKFLRSRRESPGRKRANAGSGGRLFRFALYITELSGRAARKTAFDRSCRIQAGGIGSARASATDARRERQPYIDLVSSRARLIALGQMRNGP